MRLTDMIFGWQGAIAAEFLFTWLAIYFVFMRTRKKPAPARPDTRFNNRFQSRFKGWLVFNGKRREIRGINLNTAGARITSGVPLAAGARVFLYIESARLMGWAEVRHCVRRRLFGYYVGLEFRGSLMRATEGVWQFQEYPATSLQSN